ncbi:MAG: HNH endonuclease [Bacillota bacterium]
MRKRIDLNGKIFGELKVIKLSDKTTKNNTHLWDCECVCGNVVYVLGISLRAGHYKSCGCKRSEKRDQGLEKHLKEDMINGTRKSALTSKLHKNNKSGHKGVRWNSTRKKWTATIGFQGKQIFIGNYDILDDAVEARKKAEEKYHLPYLGGQENE